MSSRAVEVSAAFLWGVPLHVWDGTGDNPTDEQKAEMVAYVKSRSDREAWEEDIKNRRLNSGSGTGVKIG